MAISVFDLFSVGIGPSSSHTVGPMRAARMFARRLKNEGLLAHTASIRAELYGSLGATGHGHGTPKAVLLGLEGESPQTVDVETADTRVDEIRSTGRINLLGMHEIPFAFDDDLVLHRRKALPYHANGMTVLAYDTEGAPVLEKTYYSVGGGFVVDEDAVAGENPIVPDDTALKHPFRTGDELLRLSRETGLSISSMMLENELAWRTEAEIRSGLLDIWRVMQACVSRGMSREGILPGGLKVRRRAANSARQLRAEGDPQAHAMEWITLYAMAVNEENAAGGRVVTAPTNGCRSDGVARHRTATGVLPPHTRHRPANASPAPHPGGRLGVLDDQAVLRLGAEVRGCLQIRHRRRLALRHSGCIHDDLRNRQTRPCETPTYPVLVVRRHERPRPALQGIQQFSGTVEGSV
ncbi:L-serine dehydratase 1 [Streptomyces badius]